MTEIMPVFDYESSTPLYVQLYEYIKKEINNGSIAAETKLPSKRKLAVYLGVSQNTILNAYEQLCAEGYVESRPRVGLFVKNLEESPWEAVTHAHASAENKDTENEPEAVIDFYAGNVDLDYFPYAAWRKLSAQNLYQDHGKVLFSGDPQGEQSLRTEIAKYLFQTRSVRCSADQIVIGSGSQYLLMLLSMVLGREHLYAIEDPGYNRARTVFLNQGIAVKPIPVEEDGISIDALRKTSAKVVYITPSHQFPMGMIMPVSKRLELLKWCEERDGFIIEDDYDSEFRHKGKPVPSLQGLDPGGNVIYMGTFSKSLIPSIRISYLVIPYKLLDKYKEYSEIYKQTVSRLHQETLCSFMREGHFLRHINKMRALYRRKHGLMLSAIEKHMKDKIEIIGEGSGLHLLLKVKNGMSEVELIEAARQMNVKVYPTSIHYAEANPQRDPAVLLGFGGVGEQQIEAGILLLSKAWFNK